MDAGTCVSRYCCLLFFPAGHPGCLSIWWNLRSDKWGDPQAGR